MSDKDKPKNKDVIFIDFEGEGVKPVSIKALTTKTKFITGAVSSGKIKHSDK